MLAFYLQPDRGHRGRALPRESSEVLLDERAIAELNCGPGGHVVEAMVRYPGSPSRRWGRYFPIRNDQAADLRGLSNAGFVEEIDRRH